MCFDKMLNSTFLGQTKSFTYHKFRRFCLDFFLKDFRPQDPLYFCKQVQNSCSFATLFLILQDINMIYSCSIYIKLSAYSSKMTRTLGYFLSQLFVNVPAFFQWFVFYRKHGLRAVRRVSSFFCSR